MVLININEINMSLSIQDRTNRHLETIALGVTGMALALQYMFDLLKSDGNVYFRYSLAGTPHIVINLNNTIYSVVWFHSTKTYTIFFPWESHDQEKVKFLSPREVLVYFTAAHNQTVKLLNTKQLLSICEGLQCPSL